MARPLLVQIKVHSRIVMVAEFNKSDGFPSVRLKTSKPVNIGCARLTNEWLTRYGMVGCEPISALQSHS